MCCPPSLCGGSSPVFFTEFFLFFAAEIKKNIGEKYPGAAGREAGSRSPVYLRKSLQTKCLRCPRHLETQREVMVRTRGKETTTESEELCPSVLSCCGCGKRVCPMGGVRARGLHVLGGAGLTLPFGKCHQPFITWELRHRIRNIILEGRSCSPVRLFLPAQSKRKLEAFTEPLCFGQH